MSAAGLALAAACSAGDPPAITDHDDSALITANSSPQVASAVQTGREFLLNARGKMGLDGEHAFVARSALVDNDGRIHVRYNQLYRGVRVWEGDAIVHQGGVKRSTEVTSDLKSGIALDPSPALNANAVLSIAHRELRPVGRYVYPPKAELIVYAHTRDQVRADAEQRPNGELNAIDVERVITGYSLAYWVQTALQNGAAETRHTDYIIDARNGAILKQWDSLQTAAATGTGISQYNGTVSLNTNTLLAGGWELRDEVSSMHYATYDLAHTLTFPGDTPPLQGTIYIDFDNTWGDGGNYRSDSSTTSPNGQTAAVDVHYGVGRTAAYYSNVLGRNGIDGAGRSTYSRVHNGIGVGQAFWDEECFCMTFGDGNGTTINTMTSLDVVAHEMAHGITASTANLTYSGESGGLNESMSDITAAMVGFYRSGSTIDATGGNWTIGEQLSTTPNRYMYRPSLDGASRDAWSNDIGSINVHYSSGPSNRMFYFLSQGASSTPTSDSHSTFRPCGMTGVGNDHAARIAYRALAAHMNSGATYVDARAAYLSAAGELYGTSSADYAAVQNAFHAINVGAGATPCSVADAPAQLVSPAPGSTLSGSSATFSWTTGSGVLEYFLYVGSWVGGGEFFAASLGASTSAAVSGMATDGRTLYVRVWSRLSDGWRFFDYTLTAASIGAPAVLYAPAPGSTLPGSAVTFYWTTGNGVSEYYLYVGSSLGAYDLYAASQGLSTSGTATGLPADGRTLYVRLWSWIGSGWQSRDYTYTATSLGTPAVLYSPAPGSTLPGATATFSWTTGSGVSEYYLYVGSSVGAYNLYAASQGMSTSGTVTGLPTDGRTLYVRLWSWIGSAWQSRDYTYTAASTCHPLTGTHGQMWMYVSGPSEYAYQAGWCSVGRGLPAQCFQGTYYYYQYLVDSTCSSVGSSGSCYASDAWWWVTCDALVDCIYNCAGQCIKANC